MEITYVVDNYKSVVSNDKGTLREIVISHGKQLYVN